jgi:hypothetical protein
MSQEKYIGMDVHQTISVAVLDAQGKLIMECLLESKAATIRDVCKNNVQWLAQPCAIQKISDSAHSVVPQHRALYQRAFKIVHQLFSLPASSSSSLVVPICRFWCIGSRLNCIAQGK